MDIGIRGGKMILNSIQDIEPGIESVNSTKPAVASGSGSSSTNTIQTKEGSEINGSRTD